MNHSAPRMSSNPALSVIVPVYNLVPYLTEGVESILNQSFEDLEVLLVDDGSTDGSAQLCDTLSQQDKRIKVFHKDNGGQASARNFGLEQARGNLIGFVDGDDWIEPDFYTCLARQMDQFEADLSACSFVKVTDRKQLCFQSVWESSQMLPPVEALRLMFEKTGMRYSPCDKLYKHRLFEGIRYPEGCLYEDKATTYKLLHQSQIIAYSPSTKYHYYVRADSVMRRPLTESNMAIFKVNEALIDFLKTHYPELTARAEASYAEECEHLLARIVSENYLAPEAMAHCKAIIAR